MTFNQSKLLSGRVPVTDYANLTSDRYQFLSVNQAEPNLGPGANSTVLTITTNNTRVWSNSFSVTGNIGGNYVYGNGAFLTGVQTSGSPVTNQTISGDGTTTVYTLTSTSTADSILVSTNGLTQAPNVDYTVAGNTITFTTAPAQGDIMQIRYLANNLTAINNNYGNSNVAAYGEAGWAGNIIPSGNAVYSLGNSTNQWADLWVSNATIYIDSVPLTLGAGNVLTVNGQALLSNDSSTTITTTGNITANTFILANGVTLRGQVGNTIALGAGAGVGVQGLNTVAIGTNAGVYQGYNAVAIGLNAGNDNQGISTIAIGQAAGSVDQDFSAIAIGAGAGNTTQGRYSIAIGRNAGQTNQANNSIILNATGAILNQTTANTFTVAPVRNDVANVNQVMFYNTTSKEITYGNTISVAGNITTGNISTTGNIQSNGLMQTRVYTVDNLPNAQTSGIGARAFVSDSSIVSFNSLVSNGGTAAVPVFSDGTAWRVG
jgi:hypothetical protein